MEPSFCGEPTESAQRAKRERHKINSPITLSHFFVPHNGIVGVVSFRSFRSLVVSFVSHESYHARFSTQAAALLLIHRCLTLKFSGLTRFRSICRTAPRRQEAAPPVHQIRRPRGHRGIILVDTRPDTGARKYGPGASERFLAPCTSSGGNTWTTKGPSGRPRDGAGRPSLAKRASPSDIVPPGTAKRPPPSPGTLGTPGRRKAVM